MSCEISSQLPIAPWSTTTIGQMLHTFEYRAINYESCSKRQPLWNIEMSCMNIALFHEERYTGCKAMADG